MPLRWKPQTSLRWLAFFVLVLALALGWYRDHQQAEEQLARMPGEIEVAGFQLSDVTMRLANCVIAGGSVQQSRGTRRLSWSGMVGDGMEFQRWTVEEFLKYLDQAASDAKKGDQIGALTTFRGVAFELPRAPDDKFNQAFLPLLSYAEDPDPSIREETLNVIEAILEECPARVEPFHSELIGTLVKTLSDKQPEHQLRAIECLQEMGPTARPALEPLQKIAANSRDPWRVHATLAVAAVDAKLVTLEQLKDLIRRHENDWELVAKRLIENEPADEVEAFFQEQFRLSGPGQNEVFAELLNDLALETMRSEVEASRNED